MFIQLTSIMDFLVPEIGMDKGERDMNEIWTSRYSTWRERATKNNTNSVDELQERPGVMGASSMKELTFIEGDNLG